MRPDRAVRIALPVSLVLAAVFSTASLAAPQPPDVEAATLAEALAANPDDAAGWIRLADLQRIMGYDRLARESFQEAARAIKTLPKDEQRAMAAPYYTSRAWLEYSATDWAATLDCAELAVTFDGGIEAKLLRALARAVQPRLDMEGANHFLREEHGTGLKNGARNWGWLSLTYAHYHREPWSPVAILNIDGARPGANWGEQLCRRDYGAIFEEAGYIDRAAEFYTMGADRSEIALGTWATRREGRSTLARATDPLLPFWTNPDGGYVEGSLPAYTAFACDQVLAAGPPQDRDRWAENLGDGAARCLAIHQSHPWPWLWRAIAWQVKGQKTRADADLGQAVAEYEKAGVTEPLLDYALGRRHLEAERYAAALPLLQGAVDGRPDLAAPWSDLGLARAMTGDREGALAAFDRALAITPTSATALHNRGMLHLRDKRFAEALADLAQAAEVAPGDPQVIADLQLAHSLAGAGKAPD